MGAAVFSLVVVGLVNRSMPVAQPVKQAAGEIFRQPIDSAGPNAFTASVSKAPAVTEHTRATPSPSTEATPPADTGQVAVSSSLGSEEGLYGGTRNISTCDSSQLVTFLSQNPGKASAWVQALNSDRTLSWSGGNTVRVDQIGQYVSQLTPVLLRYDARVTNHGFANGGPDPYQSVLEAGTAVLVDYYGIPRVRCACGNPLTPPVPVSTTPTYTGTSWQGFTPTTVVVVQPPPVIITTIVIIDVNTGERLGRRVGTTTDTPVTEQPQSPSPSPEATPTPLPTEAPTVAPTPPPTQAPAPQTPPPPQYSAQEARNIFDNARYNLCSGVTFPFEHHVTEEVHTTATADPAVFRVEIDGHTASGTTQVFIWNVNVPNRSLTPLNDLAARSAAVCPALGS